MSGTASTPPSDGAAVDGAAVGRAAVGRAAAPGALWIVDLDGVVWLTGEPIGDVAGAVDTLRAAGIRVVFATNNSAPTTAELVARLDKVGIDAPAGDLLTSAGAVASLLEPGQAATVVADGGVLESLAARGVTVRDDGPVDVAVVGWTRSFDFDRLATVAAAARASGRLVGTNEDPTHPTPGGLKPGTGSLLAAVATASGIVPEIAGKPHQPMANLLRERLGLGEGGPPALLVGDQPRTDGRMAERLGIPFALVDSGVTPSGTGVGDVPVAVRYADLVSLVRGTVDHR